jgi:hypothetical protein
MLGMELDAVHSRQGIVPDVAFVDRPRLDQQEQFRVGPLDEGEEGAVEDGRVGALITIDGLREQAERADDRGSGRLGGSVVGRAYRRGPQHPERA